MVNVCIAQMDNRITLDYLLLSKEVNMKISKIFNYDYLFYDSTNKYIEYHPIVKKIYFINDFLNSNSNYDVIVFMDSDAWINNGFSLNTIINHLMKDNTKIGCYSRDPFLTRNTYINSGAFILKNNDESRQMYKDIINTIKDNPSIITGQFYDQHSISDYVFKNKDKFIIFNIEIMNTPIGTVIRHNWHKNKRMFDDLYKLLSIINNNDYEIINTNFTIEYNIDNNDFPNKQDLEDYSYLI
jgi:hypothetical protein